MRILEAVTVVLLVAWIPLLAISALLLQAGLRADRTHSPLKHGFGGLIKPEDLTPWGRKVRVVHNVLAYGFPVLLVVAAIAASN